MNRVHQHIVPCMLNEDQNAIRMGLQVGLISAIGKYPSLLGNCYWRREMAFLCYQKSKRAPGIWKSPQSPRNQKFRQKIFLKGMLCQRCSDDIQRIVLHPKFIP
ncbi:hypothetical protein TNCV_4210821 [Trichonephila clavipes]|nr:hypothetical protein TNCV_4210821 [Trichonephila clavipes]